MYTSEFDLGAHRTRQETETCDLSQIEDDRGADGTDPWREHFLSRRSE